MDDIAKIMEHLNKIGLTSLHKMAYVELLNKSDGESLTITTKEYMWLTKLSLRSVGRANNIMVDKGLITRKSYGTSFEKNTRYKLKFFPWWKTSH